MKTPEMMKALAQEYDLSQATVKKIYASMLKMIYSSLSKQEDVILQGLGILKVKDRKARMGRNPKTGEQIQIPAKKVIKFRVKKELKVAVLGK